MLASVLETAEPGQRLLLAGFGNGCDAIVLETTDALAATSPKRGITACSPAETPATIICAISPSKASSRSIGAPAPNSATNSRSPPNTARAETCSASSPAAIGQTGIVQFPKTPISVAPNAGPRADYEDICLADLPARIVSFTADWLTYHPSPPFYFGLVQFENGARVMMEFVDAAKSSLAVGAPVEMTFRIKEIDRTRAYRHYFWKATPQPPSPQEAAA